MTYIMPYWGTKPADGQQHTITHYCTDEVYGQVYYSELTLVYTVKTDYAQAYYSCCSRT